MDFYYVQPKYFNKFACIGGECQLSCCDGWRVDWSVDEIGKLMEADASDELRNKIERSFVRSDSLNENYRYIELLPDRRCPFHNAETGLCDIQKELGEDKLGGVCGLFPRHYIGRNNIIIRWLNTSCPAVIDLLISRRDSVVFEKQIERNPKKLNTKYIKNENDNIADKEPILKYRTDLLDFYADILISDKRSVESSLVLGGIASKHLSELTENNRYAEIPSKIQSLKKLLNDPGIFRSVDSIKPNYQLKFKLVNNLIVQFIGDTSFISILHDGNELIVERYIKGIENFEKAFDNNGFALKNIIINEFFDLEMPIGVREKTIFENYSYFVLCAAVFETIAASVGYRNEDIVNDFKLKISRITRQLSHNQIRRNQMMDNMKTFGIVSPAHLALIIK